MGGRGGMQGSGEASVANNIVDNQRACCVPRPCPCRLCSNDRCRMEERPHFSLCQRLGSVGLMQTPLGDSVMNVNVK